MNLTSMRRLERWLGVPLCLALTVLRRLGDARRRLWRRPAAEHRAPAVLLVKLAEMGSTVLALPSLRRLRQLYPDARLHYVCLAGNEAVLDLFRDVPVQAHVIRLSSIRTLLADAARVAWAVRRQRIDVAISLEVFSRAAAALVYLSGAPVRVGFHRFHAEGCNCGDLYTHRVHFNPYLHMSVAFLTLAEASRRSGAELPLLKEAIDPPGSLPPMDVSEPERQAVLDMLAAAGYPSEDRPPILVLNANSSDLFPLRRWPPERFEQLAGCWLASDPQGWVVLTGAPDEAAGIEAIARRLEHGRVISLAGKTTLRQLVVLLGLADVLVSNDSGPAQFAALTSIPAITLFGPETPVLYAPLSKHNRSLSAGLACSPCINAFNQRHSPCTDNRCLQGLTVDEVLAAVRKAMAARRS